MNALRALISIPLMPVGYYFFTLLSPLVSYSVCLSVSLSLSLCLVVSRNLSREMYCFRHYKRPCIKLYFIYFLFFLPQLLFSAFQFVHLNKWYETDRRTLKDKLGLMQLWFYFHSFSHNFGKMSLISITLFCQTVWTLTFLQKSNGAKNNGVVKTATGLNCLFGCKTLNYCTQNVVILHVTEKWISLAKTRGLD